MRLLSDAIANSKLVLNQKISDLSDFIVRGLSLAPSNQSGYNVCPMANKIGEVNGKKASCGVPCVGNTGLARVYPIVKEAQIRRTKMFYENRNEFFIQLVKEMRSAIKSAAKQGKTVIFRLNTFSDITWEHYKIPSEGNRTIFEIFPQNMFYDYTKIVKRMFSDLPENYNLTYSFSEISNWQIVEKILQSGKNVAIVFAVNKKDLQKIESYKGFKVINGDKHDIRLRSIDGNGVIVGLSLKGKKDDKEKAIKAGFAISK